MQTGRMGTRTSFNSGWEKSKVQRRAERDSSQNKEYHLLLSWSRHGEERLEAEYNTPTQSQT